MERRMRLLSLGLVGLVSSSCGGGGGSPPPALTPGQNTPTATPTPLRAGSNRNQATQSSDDGSITLRVEDIVIQQGRSTLFTVFLTDASGTPAADQHITFETGPGLQVSLPSGDHTRADGSLTGSVLGLSGGSITAKTDKDSPFNGLSVTLTIIVVGGSGRTPTPTGGGSTVTPTPLPCTNVQTIIVQTDALNVSSQAGGMPLITAVAFNSDNLPVSNINVLFDVQPRVGTLSPLVNMTGGDGQPPGQTTSRLTIPPNSSFGTINVSASACGISGSVNINIVSGVSTKPVNQVVLQADPSTVGSLSGGTINLTAAVFDADNKPINGIDVLFITAVGKVNPLVDRTKVSGSQGGIATSVLQIAIGAIEQEYTINSLAGGISGSTKITVVPGRVGPGTINPGVPPGEPAAITLGASPTRIQVSGTGGTDLATVIGRVFDNNGNPLSGVRVHYHVVPAQSAPGAVILPVTTPTPNGTPIPVPTTLCSSDDPVAVSDTAGFAVIQVRSGTQPGPVTVQACADTTINGVASPLREQQALVTVTSGPVARIGLVINGRFIDNNDGSLLTTASAVVTDALGNTVEDGIPVFFEIVLRRVCSGGSNDGHACTSNATCDGGTCVEDDTDPSRSVAISSNTTTNGTAPCDVSQFPVQTGLPISPQPGDAITCIKYPSLQAASEVVVRASVGGIFSSVGGEALTLPGTIGNLEVSVSPPSISVTSTAEGLAVVRAAVLNTLGDGIENVRVRFATTMGTIDRSVLTDANGDAEATLEIPAGTPSGTAALRVTGGGLQLASITVPIVNSSGTSGTPTPSTGGQPAAIRFINANPTVIGVRGSGLPEQSTLTFQVTDGTGVPLAGVQVMFSIPRIADESITPNQATTDADGKVQVTLTSGQRALSVQVTAQVTTITTTLITRSTAVSILGGPPSQPNFSVAHRLANISGRVTFGIQDQITAFVADRFGNPVPAGTAVNFTTKGGAIGDPTTTNALGQATATLISQQPIADNGIVATLATTNGERPFTDANGSGVCDDQDALIPVSEPFYDENCNRVHDDGEDFIDLNANGRFDIDQISGASGQPTCQDQLVLFESICTTFSGPTSVYLMNNGSPTIEAGGTRDFTLIISDNPDAIGNPGVGNPIVGGSTVDIAVQGGRGQVLGITNFTMADAQTNNRIIDGINRFQFSVTDNQPNATNATSGAVVVTVNSAPGSLPGGGNGSVTTSSSINFLAAPTPTPTVTLTPTAVPTPTAMPVPPAIAPNQATLAGGSGAQPNACNGATQTFVVTGGSPPFTVFAGGGCISINSVPASGGSFTFTAGNTLGDFSVTVTDSIGRTASAGVTVLGPPTPTVTPSIPPTPTPTVTPIGTATASPPPTATGTATPPAGSIQFISAQPASIGVRGSGLPEQSVLTFRVNGTSGAPIGGVAVQFTLNGTGSESLNPLTAISGENGQVTTAVTSGIQAAAVRVIASLIINPGIATQSTAVSILGAPPAVNHFSVAPARRNVQGRVTFGLQNQISAFVNDHFGNAVPAGTAVSFITNAASVVNPTTTDASGVATATLLTEGLVPPSGIVTVLAYTRGEESFLDNNGNGFFDGGDTILTDDLPEPFIDFRPLPPSDAGCSVSPPSRFCNGRFDTGTPFERFIDTNANGVWNSGPPPTGTTGQGTHNVWDNSIFVFATTSVTFSGPLVTPTLAGCSSPPCNPFVIPNGGSITFTINVHDDLLNPIVGGSSITVTSSAGAVSGGSITVPDGQSFNQLVPGLTQFSFVVADADATTIANPPAPATLVITVTSPNGNGTAIVASGTVQ